MDGQRIRITQTENDLLAIIFFDAASRLEVKHIIPELCRDSVTYADRKRLDRLLDIRGLYLSEKAQRTVVKAFMEKWDYVEVIEGTTQHGSYSTNTQLN